jgi:hypothetical protein
VNWLSRFFRAILIGGDASEPAELQRPRPEQELRREKDETVGDAADGAAGREQPDRRGHRPR